MTVSSLAIGVYTVIDPLKNGGMSIDFIGTHWKKKTLKSSSEFRV